MQLLAWLLFGFYIWLLVGFCASFDKNNKSEHVIGHPPTSNVLASESTVGDTRAATHAAPSKGIPFGKKRRMVKGVCVYIYIYIYIYTYIHTCVYTYMHTYIYYAITFVVI